MKKLLIASAVVAASAITAVTVLKPSSSESAVLEYIPADTPIFMGNSEPQPLSQIIDLYNAWGMTAANLQVLSDAYKTEDANQEEWQQALNKATAAYYQLLAQMMANQDLAKHFSIDFAVYSIDGIPVFRLNLPPLYSIFDELDKAELPDSITVSAHEAFGATYREYKSSALENFSLIIAQREGQLVVTLNTAADDQRDMARTLGAIKPETSLKNSPRLSELTQQYMPYSLVDIDTVQLTDMISLAEPTLLSEQIFEFLGTEPTVSPDTVVCQQEYHDIATLWPRVSGGYTEFSAKLVSSKLKLHTNTENPYIAPLQDLRGHISPNITAANGLFSMALGLNTETLVPSLTTIWSKLIAADLGCSTLSTAQSQLQNANPALMGAATGMIQGSKGIGFSILEMGATPQAGADQAELMQAATQLEGYVVLSTENTAMLAALAQLAPPVAALAEAENGQMVTLELVPGMTMRGVKKGKDVVIAVGSKAEQTLAGLNDNTDLSSNGLDHYQLDMTAYFELILQVIKNNPGTQQQISAKEIEIFELMASIFKGGEVHVGSDIVNDGVQWSFTMQLD